MMHTPTASGLLRKNFFMKQRARLNPVETAGWVDLACLLFLFFIVGSRFVVKPAVTVELPEGAFVSGAPADSRVVTVAREGMIFFDDELMPEEGLAVAFARLAADDPETHIVIEADRRVSHGIITDIYHMAMHAGLQRISIATRRPAETESAP